MADILVVDDEEGIRSFLAEALELDGHTVTQAADGSEARNCLQRHAFELVVTDLNMPNTDGLTLMRWLGDHDPDAQVIVLTAHGSVATAVEAMKLGAFDYLQKPISGPAEIRLLARRALERRQLLALRERSCRDQEGEPRLTYGDPAMASVVSALRKVAATDSTVLVTGESGTGKEVAARAVHAWSRRAKGPFAAVNCAALAESLIESELFGHEKGAFTGATERRRGRLELADGGTFFLDEIGELKPELQAKLLRVLEQRSFERVGGSQTIKVDVRWIAATNRKLDEHMREGRFREDLYHRIATFPVTLPPLRDRRGDILPLAQTLLSKISGDLGVGSMTLSADVERLLTLADWPGNVRELANVLERAVILAEGSRITLEDIVGIVAPSATGAAPPVAGTLEQMERDAIRSALAEVQGNRRQAAERLGIGLRTLYDKLKRYGLE